MFATKTVHSCSVT